ncbi:MAG: hypothetical protein HY557_02050, partial [Euryarchaeota archaeon]|nr:hypothetical protein [Euryarchaeota archaeon]
RGLASVAREHETFAGDGAVAVFVPKEAEGKVRDYLARFGFTGVDVPKGEGDPKQLVGKLEADHQKWTQRLAEIEARIARLRERYARFVVEAEDRLQVEIEKAEAPLRFAVSEHSFVIDGWVPSPRVEALRGALALLPRLHVDTLEGAGHGEAEGPPVLLRNRGPARRFEFLTNLYSTPRYDEADPTTFLFLLFPIFFGLMIGDAGYGLVMIALGFILSVKLRDNPDFADLMRVILYGGLFAYIFGLLLYGEIFGIPFHAPAAHPEEVSWSAILGFAIPYSPPIHKLEAIGVIDLLLLSIVASFIHLGTGYVVGFFNELHHDRKHALSRLGWLFVLVGLFGFFAVLGRTPAWCEMDPANAGCLIAEHRVVNQIFFDQPPLVWIPADGVLVGGMTMPFFSLAAIGLGILVLLPTEGLIAPVETISLLANMMSYTRLAGVAVAKGAVALAFNTMFLPLIINDTLFRDTGILQLNPNLGLVILGFVFLFLSHALVLILGAISAGIQSIRLNYVEFFLKFFKGGGSLFSPFGARKAKPEA